MMGATFPTESVKPDFHRHNDEAERFVRLEYGESDLTWILREIDKPEHDIPMTRRRPSWRFGFSLRALAAKVASLLFYDGRGLPCREWFGTNSRKKAPMFLWRCALRRQPANRSSTTCKKSLNVARRFT